MLRTGMSWRIALDMELALNQHPIHHHLCMVIKQEYNFILVLLNC